MQKMTLIVAPDSRTAMAHATDRFDPIGWVYARTRAAAEAFVHQRRAAGFSVVFLPGWWEHPDAAGFKTLFGFVPSDFVGLLDFDPATLKEPATMPTVDTSTANTMRRVRETKTPHRLTDAEKLGAHYRGLLRAGLPKELAREVVVVSARRSRDLVVDEELVAIPRTSVPAGSVTRDMLASDTKAGGVVRPGARTGPKPGGPVHVAHHAPNFVSDSGDLFRLTAADHHDAPLWLMR